MKNEVKKLMLQVLYAEANLLYSDYKASGSEEDLAEFREFSKNYIQFIDDLNDDSFNPPENWAETKDSPFVRATYAFSTRSQRLSRSIA